VAPNKGGCSPDPYQRRPGRGNLHAVLLLAHPFSLRYAIFAAAALLLGEKTPRASSSKHTAETDDTQPLNPPQKCQ
jgi:hypothetical protein